MDIKDLKKSIEDKTISVDFMIFKYTDIDFLPNQYIKELSKISKLDVNYVDSLSSNNIDLFSINDISDSLTVFRTELFNKEDASLKNNKNTIVVCKKISKECEDIFSDNITVFPKLESWQIQDYVYSIASGLDTKKLDNLINICKNDIYRLDKELDKIRIFNENERKYVYDNFIYDGLYDDLTNHNIFDFSNALLKRDIKSLSELYKEIEKIDCEPLGLVTILYQSIKNIISIQLSPNATPESVGLPTNRFWAIKKNNCGYYSRDQLIEIFNLITSIDRKLKNGDITIDIMVDYIVCHMLSI